MSANFKGHKICTVRPQTTWANEINFVMNHAPGSGLIALPVDPQSRTTTLQQLPHTPTP